MDAKWLTILFLGILGVFRAVYPIGFKHWSSLNFREVEVSGSLKTTLFSMILFASFCWLVAFAVDIDFNPLLCLGGILGLLLIRMFVTLLLSILFSQRIGLPKLHSTHGFLVASFTYALIAIGILINLVLFRGNIQASFYILGIGHLLGLIYHVLTSPTLENINNIGSRFYSVLYLCGLELVLIFSIVN